MSNSEDPLYNHSQNAELESATHTENIKETEKTSETDENDPLFIDEKEQKSGVASGLTNGLKITIGMRVAFSFAVVLFLTFVVGIVSTQGLSNFAKGDSQSEKFDEVSETMRFARLLEERFRRTGSPQVAEEMNTVLEDLNSRIQALAELDIDEETRRLVNEAQGFLEGYVNAFERTETLVLKNQATEEQLRTTSEKLKTNAQDVQDNQKSEFEATQAKNNRIQADLNAAIEGFAQTNELAYWSKHLQWALSQGVLTLDNDRKQELMSVIENTLGDIKSIIDKLSAQYWVTENEELVTEINNCVTAFENQFTLFRQNISVYDATSRAIMQSKLLLDELNEDVSALAESQKAQYTKLLDQSQETQKDLVKRRANAEAAGNILLLISEARLLQEELKTLPAADLEDWPGIQRLNEIVKQLGIISKVLTFQIDDETSKNNVADINALSPDLGAGLQNVFNVRTELYEATQLMAQATEDIVRVVTTLEDQTADFMTRVKDNSLIIIISGATISIIIGAILAFIIGRGIAVPVKTLTEVMRNLAKGNLEIDIPYENRRDELADMARALNIFKENAIKNDVLEEQAEMQQVQEEKRQKLIQLTNEFGEQGGAIISAISSAASELEATSQNMKTAAEQSGKQTSGAAEIATQVDTNLSTVASATEELISTGRNITQQVNGSAQKVKSITGMVESSTKSAEELNRLSNDIGKIVETISDIAEQTNLLALNATIEAARAGAAGKGFAVVADEVKKLASETGEKTEEISKQVSHIQEAADNVTQSIKQILEGVTSIEEATASVASAVEEQSVSTGEIGKNIEYTSKEMKNMTQSIETVSNANKEADSSAVTVLSAAEELSRQCSEMQKAMNEFLDSIKAIS